MFFHSRPGEKDAYAKGTRDGCFVIIEHDSDDDWTSVMVRGAIQRVTKNEDAERAFEAIVENPFPPEFGIDSRGNPLRSGNGGYLWMMKPERLAGRASQSLVRGGKR